MFEKEKIKGDIDSDSVEMQWEYSNIMFLVLSAEATTLFSRERNKTAELNVFHDKFNEKV